MSFELSMHASVDTFPEVGQLEELDFDGGRFVDFETRTDGGTRFWYRNDETGVYAEFGHRLARREDASDGSRITVALNYARPTFFALEVMPVVVALGRQFDLRISDPQAGVDKVSGAESLIESWKRSNRGAVDALASQMGRSKLDYMHERKATAWWQYMFHKSRLEERAGEAVFVPTILIVESDGELHRMIVWPDGIPQFFPECEIVYVSRSGSNQREDEGAIHFDELVGRLQPYLDSYDQGGLPGPLRMLPPKKADKLRATDLLTDLELIPTSLAQMNRLAPDSFHDVDLQH